MSGRPFLQIPGPTNVPESVLRAMDRAVIDHRGPEFGQLTLDILPGLRRVFGTREGQVVLYPASGTGAWEAALTNVLAPGERVLAFNHGQFSAGFARAARGLGYAVDEVALRWGEELSAARLSAALDAAPLPYQAVLVVHNETSTGVMSNIAEVRAALDAARSDALLLVDAVSSLACVPFELDAWRVDVALAASQKGLMLPPGLGLVCISERARAIAEDGGAPRSFFDWRPILRDNAAGYFPYTPATLLLFGLQEALRLLDAEGLEQVYARHARLAGAVRAAVAAWDLAPLCENPACSSNTVTAVAMPDGLDSDEVIARARDRFNLTLGIGLGPLKGRVLRLGHLGALGELEVLAMLAGTELALRECGYPLTLGSGVAAAQESLVELPQTAAASRR